MRRPFRIALGVVKWTVTAIGWLVLLATCVAVNPHADAAGVGQVGRIGTVMGPASSGGSASGQAILTESSDILTTETGQALQTE